MKSKDKVNHLQMTTLKLSKPGFKVLCILWASENSMSIEEITEQAGYRIAGEAIVRYIMDDLITKGVVFQSGVSRNYRQNKEVVKNYYSPKIHFEEYFADQFESIAPYRLFFLLKKLLRLDKLDSQMCQELSSILAEKSFLL